MKLNEFEDRIKKDEFITHAINTLRIRRDNYHVHNDNKYFGKKLQNDKTYLKNYHLQILLDFTEEVLNYIYKQFSSEKARETKYDNDLSNLL